MPTKLMKDLYAAFIRDSNGKFSDIFHSNENSNILDMQSKIVLSLF